MELGTSGQCSNLAFVGRRRPGIRSLIDRQRAQNPHFRLVQVVIASVCPTLATRFEGTLVSKTKFPVLGAGAATLGTNFTKTQGFGQSADADCFLVGLEVRERKGGWIAMVWCILDKLMLMPLMMMMMWVGRAAIQSRWIHWHMLMLWRRRWWHVSIGSLLMLFLWRQMMLWTRFELANGRLFSHGSRTRSLTRTTATLVVERRCCFVAMAHRGTLHRSIVG